MTAGYFGQQGYANAVSQELSHADFNESSRDTGEDHSAHGAGRTCMKCDAAIEKWQPARRRGETSWVHDVCPLID